MPPPGSTSSELTIGPATAATGARPEPGIETFAPDSALRRCAGEPAMWFGAQRALLLQLAHPSIAAGVEQHSRFREQPHRRLWSTADTMLAMVWGRPDESRVARARIYGVHDRVHGALPDETPPWHRGDPYTAHDPALLHWVWSTLVDTTEVVYGRFVGPLVPDDRDALYDDWTRFARFFGVPPERIPPERHAFRASYRDELARLVVSPTGRHVAEAIVDPPIWWAPRWLRDVGATLARSTLPAALRERYGWRWTPDDQRRADRLEVRLRLAYQHLPAVRRRLPDAYVAVRRLVLAAVRAR